VRLFEHRLEIRDLKTLALLRTHARVDRPGTVVLPDEERLFNPSRETKRILNEASQTDPHAPWVCAALAPRQAGSSGRPTITLAARNRDWRRSATGRQRV